VLTDVITQSKVATFPSRELGLQYGIVGKSDAILKVYRDVLNVGPTDANVLIQGETGTGKELIARAIHQIYSRGARLPFVAINCAGIPEGLLESELFGHVKGAFTDARNDKPGQFENASGGTVFLDEIGDMPLSLQAKILRVLQEKVITRVGANYNIPIDVRIIAATNQNLETQIQNGDFRSDLYYRINVFPISVPTLSERYGT